MKYFLHIIISINQLFTSILGGWPDETMSSYTYRLYKQNKLFGRLFFPTINRIFFWQNNHCKLAYEEEMARVQFPREMR